MPSVGRKLISQIRGKASSSASPSSRPASAQRGAFGALYLRSVKEPAGEMEARLGSLSVVQGKGGVYISCPEPRVTMRR